MECALVNKQRKTRTPPMAELRQLKIKTGVVKRGHREVQSYVREVETEERRLRDFQESGQDASKIRQQEQVVAESRDMISFTRNKLATGVEQLRKELESVGDGFADNEDYQAAATALQEAEEFLRGDAGSSSSSQQTEEKTMAAQ